MPDPIFEHYKEALKAGHVAVLRGRLEEALAHYREAASIADERALPHASLGGVLLRLGRVDEALAAYARALGRAPRDEGALAGRAEALVVAGRRSEAAEVLERLADVQAASDRAPEAVETLRRALELAETKRRRRRYQQLAHAVRMGTAVPTAAAPKEPAAPTAAVPEEPAGAQPAIGPEEPAAVEPGSEPRVTREVAASATGPEPGAVTREAAAPATGPELDMPAAGAGLPAPEAGPAASAVEGAAGPTGESGAALPEAPADELAATGSAGAALASSPQDREVPPPPPDPEGRLRDALTAAEDGQPAIAIAAFLQAAAEYATQGASEAALDACERALGLAPGDVKLHLMLTRLYLERGWRDRAGDKLALLDRLLRLDDPEDRRAAVLGLAREAFPGDDRFEVARPS